MNEVDGDLVEMALAGHFDAIVHGCNCQCLMGAGIAAKIAREFPAALAADESTRFLGQHKLGRYSVANVIFGDHDILVFNAYTQLYPGRDLRESALLSSLSRISSVVDQNLRIGIPRIGCGLAGGDWNHVREIVTECFDGKNMTIVNYREE